MTDPKKPAAPPPASSKGAAETGFFEDIVNWARGKTSPAVDRGMTDTVTQAAKLFYSLTYGDVFKPGDQRFSQDYAARIDAAMDEYGKPKDFGKYDIMMAAGWQPKGPIKVNGVMTTLEKPVDNMLAVFVRNPDGSVEILDPSIKVQSLKQVPRVFDAITPIGVRRTVDNLGGTLFLDPEYKKMALTETPSDKRWRETAGVFVMVQIAPMVASGGFAAAGKGGSMIVSKAPQLEKAAEMVGKVNAVATKVSGYVGGVTAVTGLTGMGGQFAQSLYMSPASIQKIADSISSTLNAREITPDFARDNLNSALHEHSFDQGSDAKQIYIPSLKDYDQPWTRFQEVLQGAVKAHEKPLHPWQEWPAAKHTLLPEVREALNKHTGVNAAIYSSIEKHLTGKPLTDRDIFVIRAGIKLGPIDDPTTTMDLNPVSKNGTLKFTPEERAETLKAIDQQLHSRLRDKIIENPALAKTYGVDPKTLQDNLNTTFTPAQIKTFVLAESKTYGTIYNNEREYEARKAAAQVAAFTMPF